jgi:hypothetical protein
MEKNSLLAKMSFCSFILILCLSLFLFNSCNKENKLKVAISPYQDIAMIVNIPNLNLDKKYDLNIELLTMNWEDILPAISSAGMTADIGFGSLTEYLTKVNNLNENSKDPVLFIYPAYIYKGGGFITFKNDIPVINNTNLINENDINTFFNNKIGAQKNSIYEMMLFSLAKRNHIEIKTLKLFDIPMNEGLLATQNGSLDITSAGLTQITEAFKNKGRIILTMDDLGFADITGFICKKSIYETRKKDIDNFLKMWFECVDFVMQDIEKNSKVSLDYLDKKAATKYTLEQYKTALSQEYFPRNMQEVDKNIISDKGKFNYNRISDDIIDYLISNNIINKQPLKPVFNSTK